MQINSGLNFSCIYKITCLKSNKFYIGSAKNFRDRRNQHLSALNLNKHANRYLQRIYNKYGKENLLIEVIEKVDISNLIIKEQFYIDNLKPILNLSPTAGSSKGCKQSRKTKNKIREIAIANPRHIFIPKSIKVFDLSGKFIKQFRTIGEAIEELKIPKNNRIHLSEICNYTGRCKSIHGYQFRWPKDKKRVPDLRPIKYEVFKDNISLGVFNSQLDIAKETGIPKGNIYYIVYKKKDHTQNGYKILILKNKKK